MPGTRHSLGQLVVDGLADRLGIRMSSDRKGVIGRDIVTIGDTDVQLTLYKSKAAMNISGPSIAEAFRNSIKPTGSTTTHNLIVLQDSLDHLPATLSTRLGGSANGHNGIKSIISALGGKKDFYRFRLGIGRDERGGANYVLGRLPSQEKQYWREEGLDEVLNEIEKLSSVEYYTGMNFGEIKLDMSLNIVYVRSSIKALMEERRLTLIPMDEVVNKIYSVQFRNSSRKRFFDRTRLTEILPKQEYEYRLFMSSALDIPLSIIMSDGSRRSTSQDIPHFRSSVHPLLVTCHAAQVVQKDILKLPVHPPPQLPHAETEVIVIAHYWYDVPPTFTQKPDWYQDLCHPLERMSQALEEQLATYTSSSDTLDPEFEVRVARRKPKLVTAQWAKKMRKRIERKLPFDKRVSNEKQLRSYAKEKSRPYEEVMRTSRASVPFAPSLKRRPRSTDDIELSF
ncbi:hypothetical protein VNI00_000728 [Paramarasmius palmivorus]|uniref:peptidyl-tRNA hydrolase n=1 Tax=Paramarasmius palmivorus TaxID=297713 RepID=A0AAW0E6N4_9AGAR